VEAVPFYTLQGAERALWKEFMLSLNLTLGDPLLMQHIIEGFFNV